ncbi:hypothetical protein [uncultured Thioclava sp.]|uniref:hypothetical protein n=1 Tax=uncultured Thioclava sp. TaxID=473858 RepID=UPI0025FC7D89|nr:hypothetical protein [uncultured Thioclava sp.]
MKSTVSHTASNQLISLSGSSSRMTSSIWPKTVQIASGCQNRRIKSLPQDAKPYPTLEKAAQIVEAMPLRNHLQKRQRAIFAIAFLGALRADTLISLRINRDPIAPMASKHSVSEAFALACCNQAVTYTPHSAKHTIAAERNNRPLRLGNERRGLKIWPLKAT